MTKPLDRVASSVGSRVSKREMAEHVLRLCEEHSINIEWSATRKAWAAACFELIHIPPVRSSASYAIALHEIGHVLGPHQRTSVVLTAERGAWRWARRNALVWNDTMDRVMRRCLTFYEKRPNLRRDWRPIFVEEPDQIDGERGA